MITPEHIKYDTCPECHAPFKTFGREATEWDSTAEIRRHVNGGIWEYIIFTCGRKDAFIPNFGRIETEHPCENSVARRERKKQRELVMAGLKTHINSLMTVDDSFRADLLRRIGVYGG